MFRWELQVRARRIVSAQSGVLLLIALELLSIGFLVNRIGGRQWLDALIALSMAVAIPSWVLAMEAPATCGVETRRGYPCPNPTTGILLGCNNARGHAWAKLFARFGWRRLPYLGNPESRKPNNAPVAGDLPSDAGPILVKLAEDAKSTVTFWSALVSTATGVVSMIASFS